MTRSALGLLSLEAGDPAAALGHFQAALALDARDPNAIWGLQQLGVKVEMPRDARPPGHP
jgi:hypothetical protein